MAGIDVERPSDAGRRRSGLTRPLDDTTISRVATLRVIAGVATFGAGVLHAVEVEPHHVYWWLLGWGFLGAQVAQVLAGLALVGRRDRVSSWAAIAVHAVLVIVWAVSRTVGLPVGPGAWVAEPVETVDLVTQALQLGAIMTLLTSLQLELDTDEGGANDVDRRSVLAAAVLVTVAVGLALLNRG